MSCDPVKAFFLKGLGGGEDREISQAEGKIAPKPKNQTQKGQNDA